MEQVLFVGPTEPATKRGFSGFFANGLQLILAVLLIVLGLTIVIHSFKSYAKSERNSENA